MFIFIFIYEWQSLGGYVKIILNYYLTSITREIYYA